MSGQAHRFSRSAIRFTLLLLLAAAVQAPRAGAQGVGVAADTLLRTAPGDSSISLGRRFVIPSTMSLSADSVRFVRGVDYTLDSRNGVVTPLAPLRAAIDSVAPGPLFLRARFEYLPFALAGEARLRNPVLVPDTAAGRTDTVYRTAAEFTSADFFGPGLRKSGSIARGIEAGSNRDVTINSGFRLNMSGRLAEGLDVAASLTDENTPIQPEGTTQTLQELDRIFIELRGRTASATVGDIALGFSEGQFGVLNRKLRGAVGAWSPADGAVRGTAEASAASVRGKYTTNRFNGADGVQGPYRLTGRNNEYPVVAIAGTERVYVDGRPMTRGLLNDYTIDYGLGEVTFGPRRRITFASRIVVEFEYTERSYARNFLGGRARAGAEDGSWIAGGMVVKEEDDRDAPQDVTLTEEDRAILAAAGDSPALAARSGVEYAGPGRGVYELRDTTVFIPAAGGLVDTAILVYAPADTANAVYNAFFTHVGAGSGDYEKLSTGQYRYAGPGAGSYLPVRVLPFAERHAFANIGAQGRLPFGLSARGEYAASSLDRNTFSPADDGDNGGEAYDLSLGYAVPAGVSGGGGRTPLGVTLRQRMTGAGFATPERFNDVEFDREWNAPVDGEGRDLLRDADLTVSPAAGLRFGLYAGSLGRGSSFSSNRYSSVVEAGAPAGTGSGLRYAVEYLESADSALSLSTERLRQDGSARYAIGRVTPRLLVRSERLTDRADSSGGLRPTSYGFAEVVPGVVIDSILNMSFSADAGYRLDDSVRGGGLVTAVRTLSQAYGWNWNGGWASSSLDLQVQKRRYDSAYAARNTANTALVRWLSRISPWGRAVQADLYYEASPEQSSRLERVYVQVPKGTGGYRYAGDLDGSGTVDEPDFRPARFDGDYNQVTLPTDRLVPVISLKTSARLRFALSEFGGPDGGRAPAFLEPLSGETYLRIEEKSADSVKSNVYLVRVGTFLDPATTIQGSRLFLQELSLFEFNPSFSVKFRFQERRGLTRLSTGDERAYSREQGVRLRWSMGDDLSNRVEVRRLTDDVSALSGSTRNRSVGATLGEAEWTYRPGGDWESTFGFSLGRANNYERTFASLNGQIVSVAYLLRNSGRATAEIKREEAVVTGDAAELPFELTQGRIAGKIWIWGGSLEYRLTRFLESSVRYEGRKEGAYRTVHVGTMVVRAFF